MKKSLFTLLGLASVMAVSAQAPNANHNAYYTIPTVVHLVNATTGGWDGWDSVTNGPRNIPLTQAEVIQGIKFINQSLRGELGRARLDQIMQSNRDKVCGLDIELKLVTRNAANTAASTGIIYEPNDNRSANFNGFTGSSYNFQAYANAKNWDPTRYFNIYLVNSSGAGGVAFRPDEAPGGPAEDALFTQGMYLNYNAWPSAGSLTGGKTTGWTDGNGFKFFGLAAHEVGHYLNLIHAYGSQNVDSDCEEIALTNDDYVQDTPKTSEDCVGFDPDPTEQQETYACDGSTLIMRDNIMTYSNHIVLFTPDQVTRMEQTLNSPAASRNNLWTNANLVAVGLKAAADDRYCFAKGKVPATVAGSPTWINNVSLIQQTGNLTILNNNSVAPADVNSYYANRAAAINVARNQAYTINVSLNAINNAANSHDFVVVWVDWDNNGLLEDTERTVLRTSGATRDALTATNATGTITVPANATLGNKRMRVRSIYNGKSQLEYVPATPPTLAGLERFDLALDEAYSCTPCGNSLWGEVEDYTLNIQATLSTSEVEYNSKDLKVVAQNDILIVAYNGDDNITKIEITDLAGQLQKQAQVANQSTTDISQLATGTYVVKVIGEKNAYSTKFIKK